jgi:hypothetical protein
MKNIDLVIKPREGFGNLSFGQTIDEAVIILGESQEMEQIDDEGVINTLIMHYWDMGTSVFFEGLNKAVISCFETDNPAAMLFNSKVFNMGETEITSLMKANGYKEMEREMEEGELRLSFEEGLIDFFFDNEKLIAVNWGVLVNDDGEVENF